MLAVHIVFNNFYHDSRVVRETQSLINKGYKIKVLGLQTGPLSSPLPHFDGMEVILIHLLTKSLPSKTIFHLIKYFEFFLKAIPHLLWADVIHCHDLSPLPIGVFIKIIKLGRVRLIYDSHEIQSETLSCQSDFRKKGIRSLEKVLAPFVDEIITVSPRIVDYYHKLLGKKPKLIVNCPDEASYLAKKKNFLKKLPKLTDKKIFICVGLLVEGRGLRKILEAFKQISPDKAQLIIMGRGPLKAYIKDFKKNHPHIHFVDAVPSEEVVSYIKSADVGIIGTEKTCLNHEYALPNKFFEYIYAGKPVLSSNIEQLQDLIEKHHCGLVYGESTEDLIAKINSMIDKDLSEFTPGIQKVKEEFSWPKCEEILAEAYLIAP